MKVASNGSVLKPKSGTHREQSKLAAPFQDAADGITNAAEFVPTLVVSAAFVPAAKDSAAATFIQSGCVCSG